MIMFLVITIKVYLARFTQWLKTRYLHTHTKKEGGRQIKLFYIFQLCIIFLKTETTSVAYISRGGGGVKILEMLTWGTAKKEKRNNEVGNRDFE